MFKKILVPLDIDHPETAKAVYLRVADIAGKSGAEVQLISVMPGFGMPIVASYISDEIRRETVDRYKTALKNFIEAHGNERVTYTVKIGKNWEQIVSAADQWGADLIVVYHNRHHELNEVFSKSCAQRVAEHAECSVLWLRSIQN